MNRYCMDKWDKNNHLLEKKLRKADLSNLDYSDLLKLIVEHILNGDQDILHEKWDENHITVIDDGDYQGTLLFLIPSNTYQPAEYEYLMTYVGYGSCSGCDALQAIQPWGNEEITENTIKNYMTLCRHMVCNMIKPYNTGWRNNEDFEPIEDTERW